MQNITVFSHEFNEMNWSK